MWLFYVEHFLYYALLKYKRTPPFSSNLFVISNSFSFLLSIFKPLFLFHMTHSLYEQTFDLCMSTISNHIH